MSAKRVVFSIQRTYILTPVITPKKGVITCNQRIDIPTIESLPNVRPLFYAGIPNESLTVIPCIELVGESLGEIWSELNLTFETNEGVTVLPIKIAPGQDYPLGNPYSDFRYVLVLPRGATGVKSCKITHKDFGVIPHNFTFGIMPPPYNYDNALFGYYAGAINQLCKYVDSRFEQLHLTTKERGFNPINLPKDVGKRTITIVDDALFYKTEFNYPLSSESTIHKPKITLHSAGRDFVYTLSLNKTANTVLIDLFTGIISACDSANGEIIQQFMINSIYELETLSFENFDDIDTPYLHVVPKGAVVKDV